jgi:tetratricopeptide (TPR) repeat protein
VAAKVDQDEGDPLSTQRVSAACPRDDTVIEANDLTWGISFPLDSDAIIAALSDTLNQRTCPLCKLPVVIPVPLVAYNHLNKQGVVVRAGLVDAGEIKAQIESIGASGAGIELIENYAELRAKLLAWVLDYVGPILTVILTGQIALADSSERKEQLEPFRLRLLRRFADGRLRVMISVPDSLLARIQAETGASDPEQGVALLLPRQIASTIYQLIRDLVADAVAAKSAEQLYMEVEERLPPDVIGEDMLGALLSDCESFEPDTAPEADFLKKYVDHIVNAIVHARSGAANPLSDACAAYLQAAWLRWREDPEAFPRSWLPPASVAPQFIPFESLWDVSMARLPYGQEGFNFEANLTRISEMMVDFGFEDRFTEALSAGAIRVKPGPEDESLEQRQASVGALVEAVRTSFFRYYSFNVSPERSVELGAGAGGQFLNLITNGMTGGAIQLANRLIEEAIEANDFAAAFAIGCSAMRELNRASAWMDAAGIAGPLTSRFNERAVGRQLYLAGTGLTVSFWNEVGNTFRFLQYYDQSLSAYQISRGFLPLVKDEADRAAREGILAINEGRVYREQRRYGLALQRLQERTIAQPDDAEAHHGLAILYTELNRFADALREIDLAIANTDRVVHPRQHAGLLITRAVTRAGLGLVEEMAADLDQAERLLPEDAENERLRLASAAALWLGKTESQHVRVDQAKKELSAAIRRRSVRAVPSLLVTALYALGTLFIETSRRDDLERLNENYLEPLLRARDTTDWPWALLYLKARLERLLVGDEAAWSWYRAALDRADADTPAEGDLGLSVTWFADKDRFQTEITQLVVDLLDRRAVDASELLRVFEFANGRALGVRLAPREAVTDAAAAVAGRLAAIAKARGREIVVFLFADANESIYLACVSSTNPIPRVVAGAPFAAARAQVVSRQFMSAVSRANPAALDKLDRDLKSWWSLAGDLGSMVASCLTPGCEVCFLPGRSMATLPLHLLPLPDGLVLIEQHPVVFAPNLTLLLNEEVPAEPRDDIGRLVVSVTKANDTAAFAERVDRASTRLLATSMTSSRPGHRLDGTEATKTAVIEALAQCEEVFFLCHGTHGGRVKGYGICLSDGEYLPPPLLAVDDAPEFARFILGWDDLDELASAPRLVVSIACSTGRIVLASGGARLGLEQTLFARGARTIVSPLWDVDQTAALAWVNAFEAARLAPDTKTLADAYRTACLELKRTYGHLYFWAPFIASGPLD